MFWLNRRVEDDLCNERFGEAAKPYCGRGSSLVPFPVREFRGGGRFLNYLQIKGLRPYYM